MNHDMQKTLDTLVGGRAESFVQHADAFVDFWSSLGLEDQQTALQDLMTRYRLPEFQMDASIHGERLSQGRLDELSGTVGGMVDATLDSIISHRMEPKKAAGEVQRLL